MDELPKTLMVVPVLNYLSPTHKVDGSPRTPMGMSQNLPSPTHGVDESPKTLTGVLVLNYLSPTHKVYGSLGTPMGILVSKYTKSYPMK